MDSGIWKLVNRIKISIYAGYALIIAGWVAAVTGYMQEMAADQALNLAKMPTPAGLFKFGEFALATGIALQLGGRITHGFSALDRFFTAILQRTERANAIPIAEEADEAPVLRHITGQGHFNRRAYHIFNDGTVEIETLLGPRRFESISAARAFVGGGAR